MGAKYRPRGAPRGATEQPGGCPAHPRGGPARDPPRALVGPLPSFLGSSGSFREADFLYNFSGIYLALLLAGKPEI